MSSFLLPYILPYILPSTSTTLVLSYSSCVIKLHHLTLGGDGLTGQALDVLLKAWGKRCTTPTSSSSTTQPRQRGSGRGGRAWLNAEKVEVFLPDDVWQVRDGVCCVSNASLTANTPIILTHPIRISLIATVVLATMIPQVTTGQSTSRVTSAQLISHSPSSSSTSPIQSWFSATSK